MICAALAFGRCVPPTPSVLGPEEMLLWDMGTLRAPLPFTSPIPHSPPSARAHLVCESLSFQLSEFASCCFLCRVQAKNGGGGQQGGQSEGQRRGDCGRDTAWRGGRSDQPVTSGPGCEFWPRRCGYGLSPGRGGGGGMGTVSGLQTAHLPLSPIPAPASPHPSQSRWPGEEDHSPAC